MNVARTGIMVFFSAVSAPALAVDLDAPIKKHQPTIRSEIFRGRTAHSICMDRFRVSAPAVSKCARDAIARAVDEKTSTDAFAVGVHIAAWLSLDTLASVYKDSASTADAEQQLSLYDAARRRTGLTDDAACVAAQLSCESVVPILLKARGPQKPPI